MKLKEYFIKYGIKASFFANLMGVAPSRVSEWAKGKIIPRKNKMLEIEKLTEGKVKPKDWFTE